MPRNSMLLLRWSWLLTVALFVPAAMPAGGGELQLPVVRRRERHSPLLSGKGCTLRCGPLTTAPSLSTLAIGTPMRLLRRWQAGDGQEWLQVQINAGAGRFNQGSRRGWMRV
ncbi:MAG: SH3 domain-containing protein [Prochlorococcus sp.]|nr:SH3 domain-containing protein [Prochlorococcaceae cyanobacterium ETNP1_MAG_8]